MPTGHCIYVSQCARPDRQLAACLPQIVPQLVESGSDPHPKASSSQSLTHSLTHSFTHSLAHSLTHSLTQLISTRREGECTCHTTLHLVLTEFLHPIKCHVILFSAHCVLAFSTNCSPPPPPHPVISSYCLDALAATVLPADGCVGVWVCGCVGAGEGERAQRHVRHLLSDPQPRAVSPQPSAARGSRRPR